MELEKFSLKLNDTLLFFGARLNFNKPQFIRMFQRNSVLLNNKVIVSKVLGVKVNLSSDSISKATRFLREDNTYHEG